MKPDVAEPASRDPRQTSDHSVEKRLAADEAVFGTLCRLPGKVLAAAKADLEFERAIVTETASFDESAFQTNLGRMRNRSAR